MNIWVNDMTLSCLGLGFLIDLKMQCMHTMSSIDLFYDGHVLISQFIVIVFEA